MMLIYDVDKVASISASRKKGVEGGEGVESRGLGDATRAAPPRREAILNPPWALSPVMQQGRLTFDPCRLFLPQPLLLI